MLSMIGHPPGDKPLMMDVRQSGSGPTHRDADNEDQAAQRRKEREGKPPAATPDGRTEQPVAREQGPPDCRRRECNEQVTEGDRQGGQAVAGDPPLCQARLYTAIARHIVLVMAALAICAVTAALLRDRAGTQAPPPTAPGQAPPPGPGMIPIPVPEVKRLLSAVITPRKPRGHAARWLAWRRRHQARARWFHQRTRLSREYTLVT
jgi:hypothetical protein